MFRLKKIILILAVFWWLFHPCFAANAKQKGKVHTTTTTTKKSLKKKQSQKKSLKKKHASKSTKKTSLKKKPPQRTNYPAQVRSTQIVQPEPETSLVASIEKRLVDFIYKSISTFRYSAYKFGGSHFDTAKGIYIVDCSGYVDHTLRNVYPNAYLSLVDSAGTEKPNSLNYYNFFNGLHDESNEYWSKVQDVEQLEPGDILVFRYTSSRGHATAGGGHVMVVMEKPVRIGDTFNVSVADSAPIGHSDDTRNSNLSGIGVGTLQLKVNPKTGQPSAYAWKVGSRWNNKVTFAMARPSDFKS